MVEMLVMEVEIGEIKAAHTERDCTVCKEACFKAQTNVQRRQKKLASFFLKHHHDKLYAVTLYKE